MKDTTTSNGSETMMTTAEQISARYGDDGQIFEDADGVWIADACQAGPGVQHDQSDEHSMDRYTFRDGSVITIAGGGWDFGYADCWCWMDAGHYYDCEAETATRTEARR